jgi:hypothetical protein
VASLSLNEARWWTSRARPTDRSITSHPDPSSTSTSLMEWPTPHCIIKQSWSQYTAMIGGGCWIWREEPKTVGGFRKTPRAVGTAWSGVETEQNRARTGREGELLVQAERDMGSDDCTGSSWYISRRTSFLSTRVVLLRIN